MLGSRGRTFSASALPTPTRTSGEWLTEGVRAGAAGPAESESHDLNARARQTLTRWPSHFIPGADPPSHRIVLPETLHVLLIIDLCTLPASTALSTSLSTLVALDNNIGDFRVHVAVLLQADVLNSERRHAVMRDIDQRPSFISFIGVVGTSAEVLAAEYTNALRDMLDEVPRSQRDCTQFFIAYNARAHEEADALLQALGRRLVNKTMLHICDAVSLQVLVLQLLATEDDGREKPRHQRPILVRKRRVRDADAPSGMRIVNLGRRRAAHADSAAGVFGSLN